MSWAFISLPSQNWWMFDFYRAYSVVSINNKNKYISVCLSMQLNCTCRGFPPNRILYWIFIFVNVSAHCSLQVQPIHSLILLICQSKYKTNIAHVWNTFHQHIQTSGSIVHYDEPENNKKKMIFRCIFDCIAGRLALHNYVLQTETSSAE